MLAMADKGHSNSSGVLLSDKETRCDGVMLNPCSKWYTSDTKIVVNQAVDPNLDASPAQNHGYTDMTYLRSFKWLETCKF